MYFSQIYNYIYKTSGLCKFYFSRNRDNIPPKDFFILNNSSQLTHLAAPAIIYRKKILLIIEGQDSVPSCEHILLHRIPWRYQYFNNK